MVRQEHDWQPNDEHVRGGAMQDFERCTQFDDELQECCVHMRCGYKVVSITPYTIMSASARIARDKV